LLPSEPVPELTRSGDDKLNKRVWLPAAAHRE
jgi:hypothetical protein